jgi:hypothetical protein
MGASELALELLRRVRHHDLPGAIGLFDPEAQLRLPEGLRHTGDPAADLCMWLAEWFPEGAPVDVRVSGQELHAVLIFDLATEASGECAARPAATVLIDVDEAIPSRIARAHVLVDARTCAGVRQATADALEDAARERYLGRRRSTRGGEAP